MTDVHRDREAPAARDGFTLTELMIAVIVLLFIVLAMSKIFGTASDVTGLGEANADVLQESAAIEQQIRADFARLNHDGFIAIQSNAVRNDFNGAALLDPNRSPAAYIRADQLVFFVTGVESTRLYNASGFTNFANARAQQSAVARVYYGHAFQLPDAEAVTDPDEDWAPWRAGQIDVRNRDSGNQGEFDVPIFRPNQWLLSRQVVLLADDGGDGTSYLGANNSAVDIWDAEIRNGRVDMAASTLDAVRRYVLKGENRFNLDQTAIDDWSFQSVRLIDAMFFPRGERIPPLDTGSANNPDFVRREDHALTAHVLGSACSEFRVEWTYRDGKGFFDPDGIPSTGDEYRGVVIPSVGAQPWFGLDEGRGNPNSYADLLQDGKYLDVMSFRQWDNIGLGTGPDAADRTIYPLTIERPVFVSGNAPLIRYRAFFGYHREEPRDIYDVDGDGNFRELIPDLSTGDRVDAGYTPWPDAVRITMTLHDPEGRLENGRTFQFIVELPQVER